MHFNYLNNISLGFLLCFGFLNSTIVYAQETGDTILLHSKAEVKQAISNLYEIYGYHLQTTKSSGKIVYKYDEKTKVNDSTTRIDGHKISMSSKSSFTLTVEPLGIEKTLISNSESEISKQLNAKFKRVEAENNPSDNDYIVFFYKNPGNDLRKNYIKKKLKREWKDLNRPMRLVLSLNGSANYSALLLSPNDFNPSTNSELENRRVNELGAIGYSRNVMVGISRYQHGFFGSYSHNNYGLTFQDSASLDFETGLYDNVLESDELKFQMRGIGLHYRYANYFNRFSAYGSAGFVVNWLNNKKPVRFVGVSATCIVGLNYKPAHWFEAHIGPTASYFIKPLRGKNITSRPFSVGLEAGITLNIGLPF